MSGFFGNNSINMHDTRLETEWGKDHWQMGHLLGMTAMTLDCVFKVIGSLSFDP